mgnify:CR=1 FL=1
MFRSFSDELTKIAGAMPVLMGAALGSSVGGASDNPQVNALAGGVTGAAIGSGFRKGKSFSYKRPLLAGGLAAGGYLASRIIGNQSDHDLNKADLYAKSLINQQASNPGNWQ